MCYIQVSEHLRGQAAGASMQRGESQVSSQNKIKPSCFLPSNEMCHVHQNKNQLGIQNFDDVSNGMILTLGTELLDIIRGEINSNISHI